MDAIGTSRTQYQFRSWDPNLLKQMGTGKQNFNGFDISAHSNAAVDKNSQEYAKFQESLSNLGSFERNYAHATNQIFADGTAPSTIDSIEDFFKHGNLQNTRWIASNAGTHDQQTNPGTVKLNSPEVTDINVAKGEGGLSVSTKQGTTVNVRRDNTNPNAPGGYQLTISRPDGLELAFESNDNMRIADQEDGGLSIFYASTGETHFYDAEGNKKDVLQGEAGALTGTDGDDLLINLNGTQVDGGDGDDTIVNFADNATINGGNGDDTILLGRTVANNTIYAGEGNDHLLGLGAHKGSSIDMGEGDNRVQLGYLGNKSELTASDGNNDMTIGVANDSSIHLGNGNNTLNAHNLSGTTTIGNGNNRVTSDSFNGKFAAGDGNNYITIRSMDNSSLLLGNGKNAVEVGTLWNSNLVIGKGNNAVSVESLFYSDLILGNGNNTVATRSLYESNVIIGNGDNTVTADSIHRSQFVVGSGDNNVKIRALSQAKAVLGKGNNRVSVETRHGSDLIQGDDAALLKALKQAAHNLDFSRDTMRNLGLTV